jgi:predicted NAD/FAD-binding protein
MPQRIAIIGGGIAGLTAAHLLAPKHDVTLFEKTHRLGGNAYTYETRDGFELDIAVAAFGRAGYPNFYRLIDELGVESRRSPGAFISLRNLDSGEGLYITPWSARALWEQRFDLLRPRHTADLVGLYVGLQLLTRMLRLGSLRGSSMAEAIDRVPTLRGDGRRLLLAALCLMSSMSGAEVLAAPAEFFVGKLQAHNDVLSPRAPWSVRCMKRRTVSYVEALARGFQERVVLDAKLRRVVRDADGVTLVDVGGHEQAFDQVVFACNADQALELLDAPTPEERSLLGAWRYNPGKVVLHRDHSSFPPRLLTQAYTFLYREPEGGFETSVSGALWRLPGVPPDCPYLSSQHPNFPIDDALVEFETVLRTPIFDFGSVATQKRLPELNGKRRSYYCGSHFGHGLHEDAINSAIAVARMLGAVW